ncbi:MAG: hypothetical protein IJ836_08620 [Spirochaetales bacterium]|nr:hypothetical protein [Spirochaetales bacterium]
MNVTLTNGNSKLVISTLGAEPQSLVKDNVEYIWNGDKEYWFRRAPLLFPVTGPIKDDTIIYKGKSYKIPNNGFARDTEFKLVSQKENEAVFLLEESEETKKCYPFNFALTVTYTLLENGYTAKAEIDSKDNDLYFTYGWHPAFSLDMNGKGTDVEKYSLSFVANEKVDRRYQVNGVFEVEKDFLVGDTLPLTRKELDKGPIALWNIKSEEVTLVCDDAPHGVTVHMGDFKTFVCWTCAPKRAQYICLEPMYSFQDASRDQDLEKMEGVELLKKNSKKTYENTFNIF